MIYIKDSKGITLVILVIMIVVLLIFSGIIIYNGSNSLNVAQDSKLIAELQMVNHAILQQYTKYDLTKNPSDLIGTKVNKETAQSVAQQMGITLVTIPSGYTNADYYLVSVSDLSKMGLETSSYNYIVNYITGEVLNKDVSKTKSGEPLYVVSRTQLGE